MTPFRNDEQNPFGRASAWPTLPQTPLPVRRWRKAADRAMDIDEVIVVAAEPEPALQPDIAAPIARTETTEAPIAMPADLPARRPATRRRRVRLMPLLVSGALGACGLATLFLVIVRP